MVAKMSKIEISDLPPKYQKQVIEKLGLKKGEKLPKKSKYGNQRTEGYDSKHECEVIKDLHLLRRAGEYIAVAEQVPFNIGGGKEYIADAVVFYKDGTYEVIDAKGGDTTDLFKLKKALMKDLYNIDIKEVRRQK
jgi:hypothetical protein